MTDAKAATEIDCTVVVPSYGGEHRLPVLLDALARQQTTARWEVVVVLDGVIDASDQVLDRWAAPVPLSVIRRQATGGPGAAMNTGIACARGRIIIRCDDDLTPAPDFVSRHMRHHGGEPVGVIGLTRDVFPDNRYARCYGRPANERALAVSYRRPNSERWRSWAANNSAPRSELLRVGGFDESRPYGEDYELGYRLHLAGLPMVVDPELEIDHRGPARTVESRAARAFVSGASARLFERAHPETATDPAGPSRVLDRLWSRSVAITSCLGRNRRGWRRIGGCVDRIGRFLPRGLCRRLFALAVEAAGLSGRRRGPDDLTRLQPQKDDELDRERNA